MKVAVIGGGIQGTCSAMELARRGVEVDLMETGQNLMDAASRHNEGKIHLGFVYANDATLRTARLMYEGAVHFAPSMRRWLGPAFDDVAVSTPFHYAVHRESLLTADQLSDSYRRISNLIRQHPTRGTYFGIDDPGAVIRLGASDHAYGLAVDAVFSTTEVAVNPRPLADLVVKTVVDTDRIRVLTGTTVSRVDAGRRRVEVSTMEDGKGAMGPYDHIVNCAWAGRPALDRSAGLNLGNPWTFRMKYFVTASTTPHTPVLPSTTVVLGGFGDIVDYGDGDVYLSWYPAGRRGWSTELIPPAWPIRPDPGAASEITELTVSHLRDVHPGVAGLSIFGPHGPDVRGGVIYSLGNTDVDDPKSVFHRRSEVGLRSAGSYHSVDTGKYTTAPLFAELVADRITGAR